MLDAVPDLDILVAVLRAAVVVHPGRCPGSGIARGSARRCGGVQVWCAGRCPARGGLMGHKLVCIIMLLLARAAR